MSLPTPFPVQNQPTTTRPDWCGGAIIRGRPRVFCGREVQRTSAGSLTGLCYACAQDEAEARAMRRLDAEGQ